MIDALAVGLWVLPVSALRLCIMRLTTLIHELNIVLAGALFMTTHSKYMTLSYICVGLV